MSDRPHTDEDHLDHTIGVLCGEDVDAVLARDEEAVRDWAISVLSNPLDRVAVYREEAYELLQYAILILWDLAMDEAEGHDELAITRWLHASHPRGRQWSKFNELVPPFLEQMNLARARKLEKRKLVIKSDDLLPF